MTFALEIPANARLGEDAVAVVTCMVQTEPDPGDLHWTLVIYPPGHPNKQAIPVFDVTLNEDNPIKCAMQATIKVNSPLGTLVAGTNQVHVHYWSGDGKLKVSDIVVHFHVDK